MKKILFVWQQGKSVSQLNRVLSLARYFSKVAKIEIMVPINFMQFIPNEWRSNTAFKMESIGNVRSVAEYYYRALNVDNVDGIIKRIKEHKYDFIFEDSAPSYKFAANFLGVPCISLSNGFYIPTENTENEQFFTAGKNDFITKEENEFYKLKVRGYLEKAFGVKTITEWYEKSNVWIDGSPSTDVWHKYRDYDKIKNWFWGGSFSRLNNRDSVEVGKDTIFVYVDTNLVQTTELLKMLRKQSDSKILVFPFESYDEVAALKIDNVFMAGADIDFWNDKFNPQMMITTGYSEAAFVAIEKNIPLGIVSMKDSNEEIVKCSYLSQYMKVPLLDNIENTDFVEKVLNAKIEQKMPFLDINLAKEALDRFVNDNLK